MSQEFGEPYRDPASGWDFWAYRPVPLPRSLELTNETVLALSAADAALGRLAGSGRQLRDPNIFVRPHLMREALASTRIEGTMAELSDVFQADADADTPITADAQEVLNYMNAMEFGLNRARSDELPLIGRVVCEIHGVLMRDVRGEERRPGEFRTGPVWIGSPTDAPETAVFVPPLPNEMLAAWRDWEDFANTDVRMPTLVRCALLHYQFETIHPFRDGNGRLGRLLISFYLSHSGVLPTPLLYLSAYLERNRRQYYERLQAVRERGEIEQWLQFFLTATAVQAEDAVKRAEQLHDLRERYRADLAGSRSRAAEVVDLLFANPIVTVRRVQRALGITNQGARNLIGQLERRGWLQRAGSLPLRGGPKVWIASDVYATVADVRAEDDERDELELTVA